MIILDKPGRLDIECVAGDSLQYTLTITDDDAALDMTGWTVTLAAVLPAVGNPKIQLASPTYITPGNGTLAIAVDDSVTDAWRFGTYQYQLRLSDGVNSQTILEGNFLIKERRQ